jgi:outer membrane cobalamin receptor
MPFAHPMRAPRITLVAIALAALALPARAPAQQGTGIVAGTVADAESRRPLPDVAVRVEGTRLGALTDADGRFRIAGVPAGLIVVLAQRVGIEPGRAEGTLAAGDSLVVSLRLAPSAAVIAPVVVSATREAQRRADASVTIDVLDGAEVRLARAAHPAGVLNRIPGVHVSELSGEGHSMAIRQPITTKPMYLYLEDGVPTRATGFFNHNALYEVNVPQSGGIEVLKGPGTALYGSDAIGGVVNVLTRPAPASPEAEVSVEGGSFGYRRMLASGGLTHGANGVRADLNLTRSDNWKDAAPYDRASGTVRWDHFGASGWLLKTVLTASTIDQQDVPPLSAAQLDGDPALNRAPIAYRRVRAARLTSAFERETGSTLWSITPYARWDVLELLPSWQLSYDPQTWNTRNGSLGVLAKWRRDFAPMRARLMLGADADWSPGSFVAREAVTTPTGPDRVYASYTDGATHYDYDVTYHAVSPWAHAEASPLPKVRVDAGVRWDVAGYDYTTNLPPTDETETRHRRPASTDVSYRHLSPKLGVTVELAPGLGAFASWRHGFRAPSQSQLFQQNAALNTVGLEPVTVVSTEVGLRGQVAARLVWQLSAYDMTISDDIITYQRSATEREALNAGKTRHRGVEAAVGAAVTPWLRLDGSWARSRQRYVEWRPSATSDFDGMEIEQAPRELANVLVTLTPRALRGGRVAVEWSHTGSYVAGYERTDAGLVPHEYGGHQTVALHANYWLTSRLEAFARAVNLTDRTYAEIAAYDPFQKDQLTPGAPRALFAGVRLNVGR